MALYYDAVNVLTSEANQGSLKSRVYDSNANLKSKPAQVYALITECAKSDTFFKEIIDNAGLLEREPKLSPLLALLVVHDHFFSKGGIATSSNHILRQSVENHKARLQAEFTKARVRRKCATIEALKTRLETGKESSSGVKQQPRWARINTLKTSRDLLGEFKGYDTASSISQLVQAKPDGRLVYVDPNIPNLLAFPPGATLTKTTAYESGEIILQDKASCFPAELLLRDDVSTPHSSKMPSVGDVTDACAAPGNKTTHLSAISMSPNSVAVVDPTRRIFACERDPTRSKLLHSMVKKAGASNVEVLAKQDFLALSPEAPRFARVSHLLLDPSCSGSGIVGREDIPVLALPNQPSRPHTSKASNDRKDTRGQKRKRSSEKTEQISLASIDTAEEAEEAPQQSIDKGRLEKLSNLQSRIIEHAFSFPAAIRMTYSTCSLHTEENESVVARVLSSPVAQRRGWRLLLRKDQTRGISDWPHRGKWTLVNDDVQAKSPLTKGDLEACVRCYPNDEHGTMGFFVCCFVRDHKNHNSPETAMSGRKLNGKVSDSKTRQQHNSDDEWEGFDD